MKHSAIAKLFVASASYILYLYLFCQGMFSKNHHNLASYDEFKHRYSRLDCWVESNTHGGVYFGQNSEIVRKGGGSLVQFQANFLY